MLYNMLGICKYTAKRLQMPFRPTLLSLMHKWVSMHNILYRSQIADNVNCRPAVLNTRNVLGNRILSHICINNMLIRDYFLKLQ